MKIHEKIRQGTIRISGITREIQILKILN